MSSVHDVIVASGRLARGDASVAIGVNMHLGVALNIVRRWQMARAGGNARREHAFATSLRRLVDDAVVMAGATSEPGQDLSRPRTTRGPQQWRLAGRRSQGLLHDVAGRDRAA